MATTNIAYFEFKSGGSDKFYLMEQDPNGTSFTARYGRCGTTGSVATYPMSNGIRYIIHAFGMAIPIRRRNSLQGVWEPNSLSRSLTAKSST